MQKRIEKAIKTVGLSVEIISNNIKRTGRAAIYPVRTSPKTNGGNCQLSEGNSEPLRYFMFCPKALMDGVKHGDTVKAGENEYYVLWVDSIEYRCDDYAKCCMRKIDRGD